MVPFGSFCFFHPDHQNVYGVSLYRKDEDIVRDKSWRYSFMSKRSHIKFLKSAILTDTVSNKTRSMPRVQLDEASVEVSGNDVQRV